MMNYDLGRLGDGMHPHNVIVRTQDLTRVYRVGTRKIPALQGVDLEIHPGQIVALRGRSGSGKTTLLNCIGGLDRPNAGEVWFEGSNVTRLPGHKWVRLRRRRIGFVFQAHALLATYSARESVDLMLRLAGVKRRERSKRVQEVLTLMGMEKWMDHRTFELSGGQQQRVAIARRTGHRHRPTDLAPLSTHRRPGRNDDPDRHPRPGGGCVCGRGISSGGWPHHGCARWRGRGVADEADTLHPADKRHPETCTWHCF
jgi:putative ABC transport system ATP-binding protein